MNQLTARRVYEHRQQHGPFTSRQQLLDVNGFGEATFVQSAGFLKIVRGTNPLDATWIHPENYTAAEQLLAKLGIEPATLTENGTADRISQLATPLDRDQLAAELGIGRLALDDMIEALSKPGRDPRSDLPPPIFRKDVVKFEDLAVGMELRGTVLNVVDFGAFVDVGLSDSGLVHVSQLSTGYVRNPHEVVAVGDQVRVWVASIDKERRRVALTMIAPGTAKERPQRPPKRERPPRRPPKPAAAPIGDAQSPPAQAAESRQRRELEPRRRDERPKRRDDRSRRQPVRTGAYEKRAAKQQVPITKEMEDGKEAMRTFGDLLQYHRKKHDPPAAESATSPPESANGATEAHPPT
jgi:transcriptional accessory protein Tex/SPT6